MLNQRSRRADGVRWSHSHPCLHEAAVQPDYWVLLAITLPPQKLLAGLCVPPQPPLLTPGVAGAAAASNVRHENAASRST